MFKKILATLLWLGTFGAAHAIPINLTFEGLQNAEEILDFYNGGTGSMGSSGTDYGIQFTNGALGLIDADAGGTGNFANEPTGDTIAFFLSGGDLVMNVLGGFDTGFSFFYTAAFNGNVSVFDGLNGTGNLLGSLNLTANHTANNCTGDPTGTFCNWDAIGVAFGGTALSVSFAGSANQIGFDNITLGSDTPVGVDESAAIWMMALGLGLLVSRRRKKV